VGARFSTPIQTGPVEHPTSYTNDTRSVPVVKEPGCGVDHPPHLALTLRREQNYTSTLLLGLCGLSRVNFTGAADNWNLNDSHIKKAIKCQYLNLMLSILSTSVHDSYT
jgi:hypothetical protein